MGLDDEKRRAAGAAADLVERSSELAARLAAEPVVVEHGLFPPELVSDVVVGTAEGVEIRAV